MNKKIDFVVLHYNVQRETIKCVEHIKKNIDTEDYRIIIVDNASPNQSGKLLKTYFSTDEKVKVLLLEKNIGFARGNNAGIRYALKYDNPDFICAMNNDVYLLEEGLVEKLEQEYQQSCFSVLGPYIKNPTGRKQSNPVSDTPIEKKEAYVFKIEYGLGVLFRSTAVVQFVNKYLFGKYHPDRKTLDRNKKYYNVKLHGCFLVFSKKYFEKFGGFDSRTFMYHEEEILYRHLLENKMISVYEPDIKVYHREGISTKNNFKDEKKKDIFRMKNYVNSLSVLIQVLQSYQK